MTDQRWKIVRSLLGQTWTPEQKLILAVAPPPIGVVLFESPVLLRSHPPQNPVRGFVQEAVSLLEAPSPSEVAELLGLQTGVVEMVLGNLRQLGGAICDDAGRWSIPPGAPQFRTGRSDPPMERRTRRLMCYWPERQRMLPLLPRMRLRDLVKLDVHPLRDDLRGLYQTMQSWSEDEGVRRGRPEWLRLLSLGEASLLPVSQPARANAADSPVASEDILVCRCTFDVVGLTWAVLRDGVWELQSRLWSRPTRKGDDEGEPFASAEPWNGLSLPEQLLGGEGRLDHLATLFDPNPEVWRELIEDSLGGMRIRRELNGSLPAVLIIESGSPETEFRWRGLHTRLGPDARLLGYLARREPRD
jgi:hypothetical protein